MTHKEATWMLKCTVITAALVLLTVVVVLRWGM